MLSHCPLTELSLSLSHHPHRRPLATRFIHPLVISLFQVFRARTPPEAIALVSRLLEYTPSARISPLQACAHPFFNELREAYLQLPSGRGVPPLFNFTEHGE